MFLGPLHTHISLSLSLTTHTHTHFLSHQLTVTMGCSSLFRRLLTSCLDADTKRLQIEEKPARMVVVPRPNTHASRKVHVNTYLPDHPDPCRQPYGSRIFVSRKRARDLPDWHHEREPSPLLLPSHRYDHTPQGPNPRLTLGLVATIKSRLKRVRPTVTNLRSQYEEHTAL